MCKNRVVQERFFYLRFLAAIFFGCGLSACSLAPAVQTNSLEYDNTIEDVSNQSLVINVLRGGDNAPLYFPDLAIIRGSISVSGSVQSSFPYVPGPLQVGPLAAGSNPSFDIAPSNTKQFYQGLLNPASKSMFAYFVERDRGAATFAPMFLMFVNAIEVTKNGRTNIYSVGGIDDGKKYLSYFRQWVYDSGDRRITVVKNAAKPGVDVPVDARAVVEADAADLNVSISKTSKRLVSISKKSPGITICAYSKDDRGYVPIEVDANSTIKAPEGEDLEPSKDDSDACKKLGGSPLKSPAHYKLHLRSVEQLFYYLGDVAKSGGPIWDEDDAGSNPGLGPRPGCPALSFHLPNEPVGKTRFSVAYRGNTYFVAEYGTTFICPGVDKSGDPQRVNDNTMALLAILNDLLNLNRDANEVPTTKAVTSVGGKS